MTCDIRLALRQRSARRAYLRQVTAAAFVATVIVATLLAAYGLLPA
jgi:hypothetical protein